MNEPHISVVIPVFGCELCLKELYSRLKETLEKITSDFELILINDASPDGAWETIIELTELDKRVKGISLSRNFGQPHAITAGLDNCLGEWVVVMDCDLQDVPEGIGHLYNYAIENKFDVVFARRNFRKDSFFKKGTSWFFHLIFSYLTGTHSDWKIANFSIINKKVVLAFRQMKEMNRDYTFFINWLGFSKGTIDIQHNSKSTGQSSYTLKKLFVLGFDNIIANTNRPLYLSVKLGFLISIFSILGGIFIIIGRVLNYFTVEGWTSIIVSIWLVCGLLLMSIGTAGIYIGKIFDETKSRPKYIIEKKINFDHN